MKNELIKDDEDENEDLADIDTFVEEIEDELIVNGLVDAYSTDVPSDVIDDTETELGDPPIGAGTSPGMLAVADFPKEKTTDIDKNLHIDDLVTIIDAEIARNGFSVDHIASMNTFMAKGLSDIITKQFKAELLNYKNTRDKTDEDKSISHYSFTVTFTNVNLKPPTTTKYKSAQVQLMTPNMARIQDLTYSAALEVSAKIRATAIKLTGEKIVREGEVKNFRISSIPVMTGSNLCNTYGASKETLREIQEDKNSAGGSFIIGGTEWIIDSLENLANNKFHVYKKSYNDEIARGNFISKPGDGYENSRQIIIRYLETQAITVEMTTGKLHEIQVPFYLLFRLLGVNRDKEIVDLIINGTNNTDIVSKQIEKILEKAFSIEDSRFPDLKTELDVTKIIDRISHRILEGMANQNYKNNENSLRYYNNKLASMIDEYFLPHIGIAPSMRKRKARYLGYLINKLIRVAIGILESTDRDSYGNKRLTPAGVSLSKAFKTHFNIVVILELKSAFMNAFASTQFSQINLEDVFKSAVKIQDLERLLMQSITSGNRTITVKRNEIMNNVSSQQLEHKNDLNKKSQLNSIVTPSSSTNKQNERADVMRRVHPTYLGYICTAQSADSGPTVGVKKQKAISASISEATDSAVLKKELLKEPSMILLDTITNQEIHDYEYAKVFVNGDWIGCVQYAHELARLYRMKRRHGINVNPSTSIIWEPMVREVHFWTDIGRLLRPLLIVYNNIEEYNEICMEGKTPKINEGKVTTTTKTLNAKPSKKIEFKQWITLTKQHIRNLQAGKITINDLRKQRVVEYISPEELLNCFISSDLDILRTNASNVTKPYTHCDIPVAIFGLAALTSPFTNHSSGTRVTYHTNQKKQTAGWFAMNWPYMINKGVFLQYYCDFPIVRTFPDKLTNPNGQNVTLAIMCYSGYNQEDSAIVNETSIGRGLCQGSKLDVEKTELEPGEQFGNPDFTKTLDIKKNANYEYIVDGFIKKGTVVQKNYVLIVKTAKIPKPTDGYLYIDKSIVYKSSEPAIVEEVILPRSEEGVLSAKVKLRMHRPIRKGDKVSSRTGNKGIIGKSMNQADMPYTEDGVVPDIIINPHSIPSRMAINQIFETVLGTLALQVGKIFDATCFKKFDIHEMLDKLKKLGIQNGGKRRLFNGKTGGWIDCHILIAPNTYQRLLKFIDDDSYFIYRGASNAISRQPVDGRNNGGGLRIGEMETWTIAAHGTMRSLGHKLYTDSDGHELQICRRCGNKAIVNLQQNIYKCKYCKDFADIVNVPSSWIANIFTHSLSSINVKTDFEVEPQMFSMIEDADSKRII